MISKIEALKAIAKSEFRPFSKNDWDSYSGCKSAEPLISEFEEFVIVIDNDEVYFEDEAGDYILFSLEELEGH